MPDLEELPDVEDIHLDDDTALACVVRWVREAEYRAASIFANFAPPD